jgi:hypothetical protein
MAQFASSNRTGIRFIEEVTFGVTPTSPALQELRYTGESLNFNLANTTSNEIRADRMTGDLVQTSADVSGDVQVEISFGTYDEIMEGALGSTGWSTAVTDTGSDVTVDYPTNTYTSVSSVAFNTVAVVGQWVKVSGFANAANNGYKMVTAVTATTMTVAQTLVDEAAGASATFKGSSYIKNGTTYKSYTLQKYLADATTPTYFNFRGCRIGSFNMSFATAAILTGSFSVMGLSAEGTTSAISGQTVVATTSTDVMNAVGNVKDVWFDGLPSTAEFNNLSVDVNAGLRAQQAVGTLGNVGIALGRFAITGSMSLYFPDLTMYDKYLNATAFSLAFSVEDGSGNAYIITLPRLKFSSGSVVSGGLDQDVMLETNFEAIRHAATDSEIRIDRFAA